MNVYPSSPVPSYPVKITSEWKSLVSDFESGKEIRRQIWAFPKRTVALSYNSVDQTGADILWNFYGGQKGALDPFWFFDPTKNSDGSWHEHKEEYVGRGNGSAVVFELPSKETTALTVYVNGTPTSVTFLSGGGDAGVDRVQFSAAPANGAFITADFTGQIRYRMRFSEDSMSRELFRWVFWNSDIALKEVRV